MANEKYVPEGVWLWCDKGKIPTPLYCKNHANVSLFEENYANELDKIPIVNIVPFGVCSMTGSVCSPAPIMWQPVQEDVWIGAGRALRSDSKCRCGIGGEIKISFDGSEIAGFLQEVSEAASTVSLWAFVGGCVIGAGALILAPFTGGASLAALPLAAALFEVAEVTAVASIALDAAALLVQPSKKNLVIVGADIVMLGVGKALGKYVIGPLARRSIRALKKIGSTMGGKGRWVNSPARRGKGIPYQQSKSGVKNIEYEVKTKQMKSGRKLFDDYDPVKKQPIDYKDWNNGWPPKNSPMEKAAIKDAKTQAQIGKEIGQKVRWEASTEAGQKHIQQNVLSQIKDKSVRKYIEVIVNPK